MFEEVLRGKVSELRILFQERQIKGEVTLLVAGWSAEGESEERPSLAGEIRLLEAEGLSLKEIAQVISERRGIAKREVYATGVRLREEAE
jgi:16S rRNA (cytidine1402-2'-O)-methyltransferase